MSRIPSMEVSDSELDVIEKIRAKYKLPSKSAAIRRMLSVAAQAEFGKSDVFNDRKWGRYQERGK